LLNVVLVHPVIPQNTGTIARLTAATSCHLHLIEPLGFELSDKYLKRAGLDYWSEVKLTVHPSWEAFLSATNPERIWCFSTRSEKSYTEVEYLDGDYLVFGNEPSGLPEEIHNRYPDSRLVVPQDNPRIRSLNLSNCVAIVVYEARRQLGLNQHKLSYTELERRGK
jgi:tRNA (cytidine/uridine-2'-O-)-methyltransferase